jgi:hypothetical protein
MIRTTCHCSAVTITIPRAPETLTPCDCSICRRYGALWAYFPRDAVTIDATPGATTAYTWGRKSLRFIRCARCGCITHWEPILAERGSRVGVNARNFDPLQLGPLRIRRLDGAVTERYLD